MKVRGLSGRALADHVGSLAQVARVDRFIEDDGAARGARRFRMVTGGGIEIDLHPDRALDIGQVSLDGVPLAWMSAAGITAPSLYDPHGRGWLRTFGGGFLTTCGLDTFGAPSVDDGVVYGQHGRVSAVPASVVTAGLVGDHLVVEGTVRQAAQFGENLLLRRRLTCELGGTELVLQDLVTNESSVASGHMMMYHLNLGWPLVETGASLDLPSYDLRARDARSEAAVGSWRSFEPPRAGLDDEVFLHGFDPRGPDLVVSRLINPRLGIWLEVEQDRHQLPWLCQWKMMSKDAYVLGIEPVNTPTMTSRAEARERGVLPRLDPGEHAEYTLRFRFGRTG